jgi:ribosome-associated translation inhibitor RaiA
MKLPLEIVFRNVVHTAEIEKRIRSKAAKLDRICDRITGCRVVVEAPHKHHHKGNTYHVRIELTVPGDEIVVNRDPQDQEHTDLGIALRDAFQAAQRQLAAYSRKRNAGTSHSNLRITDVVGS